MTLTEREGHDVDSDDVNVGRAVIKSGLVTPADVLDALEEQGREKCLGRKIKLVDILLRARKISRDTARSLAAAGSGDLEETEPPRPRPRHAPTVRLASRSWLDITEKKPELSLTEHKVTLDFGEAPTRKVEPEPSADELALPALPKPAPRPTTRVAPQPGLKLGPWILEEEIGRGGMGVIFRAKHEWSNQPAAVKVLRDPSRASLHKRFARETEVVRRLQHPNIVRILDAGLDGQLPWFAMELITGKPLSSLIRSGALDARRAVSVIHTVAEAVHHAHETGVLHRDLKPANVLVAQDGTVKVTDFGLAKIEDDERTLTRPGAPVGTPAYMSPEQALGGAVERRTDVFSLGVMLFESVSGKIPWTPDRLATLYAGGHVALPRMRRGDAALEAIVARATERRPEDRFPSAEAFARDLEDWLKGNTPASSRLVAQLGRLRRLSRRAELALSASGGALLVFLATSIALSSSHEKRAPILTPTVPVPVPLPVPDSPLPVPVPVPVPAPVAPVPTETQATRLAKEVMATNQVVNAPPPRSAILDGPPCTGNAEELELARANRGRSRLGRAFDELDDYDSFDETSLTIRFKRVGRRGPLASIDPGVLREMLPPGEDRVNVATYLRARGLVMLADALER
jgi:serine/threonine protein kinase